MQIDLILMPLAYGCDIPGVDNGPEYLIKNNIDKFISNHYPINSISKVNVETVTSNEKYINHPKLKYLNPIINANMNLKSSVSNSFNKNNFPLVIGGDHALALGSLAAVAENDEDTLVIWFDAHGDINTDETTETGNIHGMPLASAFNLSLPKLNDIFKNKFLKPENLIYLGVRSLDDGEIKLIKDLNITHFTSANILDLKVENIMTIVTSIIKEKKPKHLHLSFDIDVLDASLVPGTGTKEVNGLKLEDVKYILEKIAKTGYVTSMDFVEFNPALDEDNKTLDICLELIQVFFENFRA